MVRVDILDRSPVYVCGLIEILSQGGIEVVGVRSIPSQELSRRADVSLVEAAALRALGPDASGYLAGLSAQCRVLIMLAGCCSAASLYLGNGAVGAVSKQDSAEDIVRAVRAASATPAADSVDQPLGSNEIQPGGVAAPLSEREEQVLGYISNGMTHRQIARRLDISTHTIDTYVKRIRSKLGVHTKADLIRAALLAKTASRQYGHRKQGS